MQEITLTEIIIYGITAVFCIKISYDFYISDKEDQEYIKELKSSTC